MLLSKITYHSHNDIKLVIQLYLFSGYGGRSETSRIKPLLDKKDTIHPPVTYRPATRTGARSRDHSPIEKSEKTASSSSSSSNRLYPKTYQRSVSRERIDSTSGSLSTIPKYNRTETSKYGSSLSTKEEIPKYMGRSSTSKDEIPRYTGRSSISKDDVSSRYKVGSRATSREDLSGSSQKYINSRFLPKNAVEKSYTAYSRPSTTRTNETSRKNRELLSVLHAQQEQDRLSRPSSRCSSVTTEDLSPTDIQVEKKSSPPKEIEMITLTVISRGTSPTPTSQQSSTFLRSRRIDIAKMVEKQITRPKKPVHTMIDKVIQSDRLDDSTKISRYAGASRISATPWSSFLDMKFSSPNSKLKSPGKNESGSDSPKSLSRTGSTKSLEQSPIKSVKSTETKKSTGSSSGKSRIVAPKQISDKNNYLLSRKGKLQSQIPYIP